MSPWQTKYIELMLLVTILSAVNCRQGGHGVRTHGGYGRGIRTRCCGEGARSTGQGAGGHGVQANQTRRCGNGHGGARLPL